MGVERGRRASSRLGSLLVAQRSRIALLGVLGAYFALLESRGGRPAWGVLGVPPLSFPFGDLRDVTAAWECTRKGIAVLPTNPCDPLGRPEAYPRLWLAP